ncbi:hypothetical protein V8G54_021099 [Vigna mungo]|uniref:Uncharacterized protein n=1 Tax=Vigna mungo TaxID=3915 RepID=A0AAQ3NFJ2_VIGMU
MANPNETFEEKETLYLRTLCTMRSLLLHPSTSKRTVSHILQTLTSSHTPLLTPSSSSLTALLTTPTSTPPLLFPPPNPLPASLWRPSARPFRTLIWTTRDSQLQK